MDEHTNRRSEDPRIQQLVDDVAETKQAQAATQHELEENTRLTAENTQQIRAIAITMDEVKTGNDSLLEMKQLVEQHISVMCTWARWVKRGGWGLLSVAGALVPIIIALRDLGLWPFR